MREEKGSISFSDLALGTVILIMCMMLIAIVMMTPIGEKIQHIEGVVKNVELKPADGGGVEFRFTILEHDNNFTFLEKHYGADESANMRVVNAGDNIRVMAKWSTNIFGHRIKGFGGSHWEIKNWEVGE